VLTHGHRDHVLGAAAGAHIYGWRVWGTLGTVWRWRALRYIDLAPFETGGRIDLGGFVVHTVATPHDVDDSAAIVIESRTDGSRAAVCTDLGWAPPAVRDALRGVSTLVIESNYDPEMLEQGPYGAELQRRVAGRTGHLSNGQAARLVRSLGEPLPDPIILAHISRHNNRPDLAIKRMRLGLGDRRDAVTIVAAAQDRVTGPFEVRRRPTDPALVWCSA
jgi:phosphoribosyl 1,2-cyclic phosphodiesterase